MDHGVNTSRHEHDVERGGSPDGKHHPNHHANPHHNDIGAEAAYAPGTSLGGRRGRTCFVVVLLSMLVITFFGYTLVLGKPGTSSRKESPEALLRMAESFEQHVDLQDDVTTRPPALERPSTRPKLDDSRVASKGFDAGLDAIIKPRLEASTKDDVHDKQGDDITEEIVEKQEILEPVVAKVLPSENSDRDSVPGDEEQVNNADGEENSEKVDVVASEDGRVIDGSDNVNTNVEVEPETESTDAPPRVDVDDRLPPGIQELQAEVEQKDNTGSQQDKEGQEQHRQEAEGSGDGETNPGDAPNPVDPSEQLEPEDVEENNPNVLPPPPPPAEEVHEEHTSAAIPVTSVSQLPADLQRRLLLNLTPDSGITLQGDLVASWKSTVGEHEFKTLTPGAFAIAAKKLSSEAKKYNADNPRALAPDELLSGHPNGPKIVEEEGKKAVTFPCSLQCDTLKLQGDMTLFFVLSSLWMGVGDTSPGQTFFGTYPDGQLMLLDGLPSFQTAKDIGSITGANNVLEADTMTIVAYRIGGIPPNPKPKDLGSPVMISVDAQPWEPAHSQGKFMDGRVSIGAAEAGTCGFIGSIGEVLMFGAALDEFDSHTVLKYLSEKWNRPAPASRLRLKAGAVDALLKLEEKDKMLDSLRAKADAILSQPKGENADKVKLIQDDPNALFPKQETEIIVHSPFQQQQQPHAQQGAFSKNNANANNGVNKQDAAGCHFTGRVEDWVPPPGADIRRRYQWEEALKATLDKIKNFDMGGEVLRKLIHDEVKQLDLLRHDLFC